MRVSYRAAFAAVLTVALAIPAGAIPIPADLSLWTPYSQPVSGAAGALPGEWIPNADGTVVMQTVNGAPTFLQSPTPVDGYRITAEFETPTFDDDFLGIALGFAHAPGDPATDYLLIDWKQTAQDIDWLDGTGPTIGTEGLAVSRVTGVPTLNEFWGHYDSPANPGGGLIELTRGATLGSIGWVDATNYSMTIEYTTSRLDIWVDGSHEISITGDFPPGPMAFYDFSQPGLEVSGVTTEQLNQAPEVLNGGASDVTVNEGQIGATSGGFVDADGDALELACSGPCDGFTDLGGGLWSWSELLVEGPDGFSVTVSASDGELTAEDTFAVTILNVAPVITSTSGTPGSHSMSTTLDVSADFTDVGVLDTHTAVFNWGDGSMSNGAVTESNGSGTTTAGHDYSAPGTYTVTVTVTDDDGDLDTAIIGQVFVFDPDTFVTGGGWVDSPRSAWTASPTHTGKATFGFVAKYDKSGTVKGNLQFQLHKGLNLHATSFDYLLINGGIATFEGDGRLNGTAGYHFKVVATDERYAASPIDLFWITIYGPGGIVYDGAAYPSEGLPIKGKGIQVHKK